MNTTKVREALDALIKDRGVIDEAIAGLQRVLAVLESNGGQSLAADTKERSGRRIAVSVPAQPKTYIDETEALLQEAGRPLHIKVITDKIGENREKEIPRASIESSLISHMKHATEPRVVRVGPGQWGLPSWRIVSGAAEAA